MFIHILDCSLVGKGACRGEGWSEGQWPLGAGVQSRDDCEDLCQDKQVSLPFIYLFSIRNESSYTTHLKSM